MRDYVGFYWTLPVPWAGHIDLPEDAAAGAALSLTIRYQRERVQRYVAEVKGSLVSEIPFIDMQHDRATEAVRSTLRKRAAASAGSAALLYVRFSEVDHWRRNVHLIGEAASLGFEVLPLPPDPVVINGALFGGPVAAEPKMQFSRAKAIRDLQRELRDAGPLIADMHDAPFGYTPVRRFAETPNRVSLGSKWAA